MSFPSAAGRLPRETLRWGEVLVRRGFGENEGVATGDLLERLEAAFLPSGLNCIGVADPAAYDGRAPDRLRLEPRYRGIRSIVVVASGGGAFWEAFRRSGEIDPPDPLDRFTAKLVRSVVEPFASELGPSARVLFPFDPEEDRVSFVDLGLCAGLGVPGLVGVLLHPRFGPWIAFRAALLTETVLLGPRHSEGFDPCRTCVGRPCVSSCPASAITVPAGWDVETCVEHRIETGNCERGCLARSTCVVAPEHRYPEDAIAYHQREAWKHVEAVRSRRSRLHGKS